MKQVVSPDAMARENDNLSSVVLLGTQINRYLGRSACAALAAGLAVGNLFPGAFLKSLVAIGLTLMLVPVMFEIEWDKMKEVFVRPWILALALFLNFVFSPLLAVCVSRVVPISDSPVLQISILLFGLIPCGGMVPAYTWMLNGNINLATAIMSVSLLVSVPIVPLWAGHLMERTACISFSVMFRSLVLAIVLPLVAAQIARWLIVVTRGSSGFRRAKSYSRSLVGVGLLVTVFAVTGLNGSVILAQPGLVLGVAVQVFLFLSIQLATSFLAARLAGLSGEDCVALVLGTSVKNNSISLAVAFAAFGPDTALALTVSGPFVQLPLMLGYMRLRQCGCLSRNRNC